MGLVRDEKAVYYVIQNVDIKLSDLLTDLRCCAFTRDYRVEILKTVAGLPQKLSLGILHEMTADKEIGKLAELMLRRRSYNFFDSTIGTI